MASPPAGSLPVPLDTALDVGSGPFVSGSCCKPWRLGQRITAADLVAEDPPASQLAPAGRRSASVGAGLGSSRRAGSSSGGVAAAAIADKRSLSLADLVEAGVIQPGKSVITVLYKGVTYTADLAADGSIEYQGRKYHSTTAFSIFCKRLITPGKQGDDGWKSVLYLQRPMEHFRKAYQERLLLEAQRGATLNGSRAGTLATQQQDQPQLVQRGSAAALEAPAPAADAGTGAGAGQGCPQQPAQQVQQDAAVPAGRAGPAAPAAATAAGDAARAPASGQRRKAAAAKAPAAAAPGVAAAAAGAPRAAPRVARASSSKRKRRRKGSPGSDSEEDGGFDAGGMTPSGRSPSSQGGGGGGEDSVAGGEQLGYGELAPAGGSQPTPLTINGQLVVDLPPGVQVENPDQWVQCDRCKLWRLVPNEWWGAVQNDPREEWYCEYAQWPVAEQPPHKPPCSSSRGGGGGSRRSGRR